MAIDYDKTVAEYEASLVTKLRGHGVGSFLEHWVPDPDPALGIFNMIEAAWTDGRDELALTVSRALLDAPRLERLRSLAGTIADLRVEETPGGYGLRLKRLQRAAGRSTRKAGKTQAARREAAASLAPEITWDIHPSLAAALDAEAAQIRHEHAAAPRGAVALAVDEKTGLISKASHAGIEPAVRRKLVELMCRSIEGRTVQDASDHAAVYALHVLHKRAGVRPAQGILLPANAGKEMIAALEIVRAACRTAAGATGPLKNQNFFEPGPRPEWQAAPAPEKLRRTIESTVEFVTQEKLPANAVKAVRVEKDIHGHEDRVVVQVNGEIPQDSVPSLLRRLERHLKAGVEPALQVYLEQWKDKSVLRRL